MTYRSEEPADKTLAEPVDQAAPDTREKQPNGLVRANSVASSSSSESNVSSTSSSDAEDEDASLDTLPARGWLAEEEAPPATEISHRMNGVALPSVEPPNFGRVKVENSTNVHLGNRTFYKGPVTIKQVVYANSTSIVENKTPGEIELGTNGYNNGAPRSEVNGSADPLNDQLATLDRRVLYLCWKHRIIVVLTIIAMILALVTTLGILLSTTKNTVGQRPIIPAVPNDSSINNEPTITSVKVVPRVEWGAQPPRRPGTPLKIQPPPYVIISHTATTFCYTQAQCVLNVRVAQTFHIESKGWDDISYNFLVGGDGLVYEGRGWDIEGAHTFNYNYKSIGISFIGTFNEVEPTPAQLYAAQKLIEYGVENGKIAEDYKLLGHRQFTKTESPGEALYAIIKTWEHWSPTP